MNRLFLLAAAACSPAVQLDAPDLPPPAGLVLEASSALPGEPLVLTVTGAVPGDEVFFGVGEGGPGPCLGGGVCLDVDVRRLLGSVFADPAGEATLVTPPFPDILAGLPLGIVAAVPGATPKASQAVTRFVGSTYATVDATAGPVGPGGPDPAAWTYFSFDDGVVTPASPGADPGWDLSFQRTWIGLNGGVSGGGATEVARATVGWNRTDEAADAGPFGTDLADADGDGVPELAMLDWFDYDVATHTLQSDGDVWVVHTTDDRYAKLQMVDYYSATGVSGTPTFRWEWIAGAVTQSSVDATAGSAGPVPDDAAWVYLDLATGARVSPADPADDDGWDLALQRTHVATNGGTTGTGGVMVAYGGDVFRDASPNGAAWLADDGTDAVSASSPAGRWYDYDPTSHTVSARDDVFLVRATDGRTYRVQFLDYYDGAGVSGHVELRWQPVPDASAP
jgi:hypothetical protein